MWKGRKWRYAAHQQRSLELPVTWSEGAFTPMCMGEGALMLEKFPRVWLQAET